ncbi:3761_t:CDS:2 [Cetraspora pellucida]|uniref:3761_t:CDS:1 n=1 Tax=Cetraspora pellucida TaxID=1433469 RepID=A0A9N9AGT7_9GLOM|nr:3761_t:CDS:2 [Cetraspora pellucida]
MCTINELFTFTQENDTDNDISNSAVDQENNNEICKCQESETSIIEEQQEHDDVVTKWILCDLQLFTVVECKEWQDMIKKEQLKLVLSQIPRKVSFTSNIWTASNGAMFLSLTIHYVNYFWKLNSFLLDIILIEYKNNTSFSKSQVADAMYQKLKNYWSILDALSQISAFLDSQYLAIPLLSNVDPLCWWQTQHLEYPTLSIITCNYLPIQATSVASEQAFSIAGKTITDERNKLDEKTTRAILYLKLCLLQH